MSSKRANFWLKLKKNSNILALAPMAGITDSAFRILCREMGADVVYSEMVSADALYYDSKKTIKMLKINKKEHPVVIQLFGKRLELFGKAAKIAEDAGADGIDINFGCPAKKVVNHGGGVVLMRNLPLCREIIKTVIAAVNIPVSVKIRAGINFNKTIKQQNNETIEIGINLKSPVTFISNKGEKVMVTALDFMKNIIDIPIAAIMIHGRTYEQGFSGDIDYEMIKRVVELAGGKIAVLGNGGINTIADAESMIAKTGVDGVGIAQGALGKPWIFREIKEYMEKNANQRKYESQSTRISIDEIKKIAIRHAKLAYKMKGDYGIVEMRKHLLWYVKGFPNAKELRDKLVRVENSKDIKEVFNF
ncbi:MAG: tRNA-dihydrouridine synthase [bacterium]